MQTVSSKRVLGGLSMAIAMALLLAAIALTERTASAANIGIAVGDNFFNPEDTTAVVGDQAIFDNNGALTHGATAVGTTGTYPALTMAPGAPGAWQLTTAETIWYYCQFHATAGQANEAGLLSGAMVGRIVVSQQTTATATTTTATATATTATATTATATATTPATNTPTSTPTATATVPAATATSPATTTAVAPGPPDTGTGTVSGTNNALLLAAAGLVVLGLAGASLVAIRRRA
jgi:plastocyanin